MGERCKTKGVVSSHIKKAIDEYNYLKHTSSTTIYREWDINLGNLD